MKEERVMALEKKPANTKWNTKEKRWEIYITPEDPSADSTIPLSSDHDSVEDAITELRVVIHNHVTYQKFTHRIKENTESMLRGKTQTQQAEGGFWPQMMMSFLSGTTLGGILAAVFTYAKSTISSSTVSVVNITLQGFSHFTPEIIQNLATEVYQTVLPSIEEIINKTLSAPNTTSANFNVSHIIEQIIPLVTNSTFEILGNFSNQNTSIAEVDQKNISEDSSWANVVILGTAIVSGVVTAALTYINFRATNRERKEKQLYDSYLKTLIDRLPAIESEIQKKEMIVERLLDWVGIDGNKKLIDEEKQKESKKKLMDDSDGSSSEADVEIGDMEIMIDKNSLSYRDYFLEALDFKNDISVYDRVNGMLITLDSMIVEDSEKIKEIILDLIKVEIYNNFPAFKELNKKNKKLILNVKLIVNLFNLELSDIARKSITEKFKLFSVKNVIDTLKDKNKLIALCGLVKLLELMGVNLKPKGNEISSWRIKEINIFFREKFNKLPHKLEEIYTNLNKLNFDQYNNLIKFFKLKITEENFIEEAIDSILDRKKLSKIIFSPDKTQNVGASSSTIKSSPASNDKKEKIKITPQKGGTESIGDNQQTFFKEKPDKEKSKEVKSPKEELPKEKTDSVLPMMDKKDVATLKK
jgi:hypothetical protein